MFTENIGIIAIVAAFIAIITSIVLTVRHFTKLENKIDGHISEINPNPLSREQVDRLNGYIRKAQQGGMFTVEEVEEYNKLVRVLEEEKPDDPNIWPLLALAAFLLGLYLVNKK